MAMLTRCWNKQPLNLSSLTKYKFISCSCPSPEQIRQLYLVDFSSPPEIQTLSMLRWHHPQHRIMAERTETETGRDEGVESHQEDFTIRLISGLYLFCLHSMARSKSQGSYPTIRAMGKQSESPGRGNGIDEHPGSLQHTILLQFVKKKEMLVLTHPVEFRILYWLQCLSWNAMAFAASLDFSAYGLSLSLFLPFYSYLSWDLTSCWWGDCLPS